METGKTLRGSANLAFDATVAVTNIVEGMYRNIAATPWPLGEEPKGGAPGFAGFVHQSIRGVTKVAHTGTDWVLGRVAPGLDRVWPPGPYREAAISALNGVCGDHLEASDNPLAIAMRLRVFLPPQEDASAQSKIEHASDIQTDEQKSRLKDLVETRKRPVEVHPEPMALAEPGFKPGGKLLIVAHGLSMSDREWTSKQHNHAEALAEKHGYTPVYMLYNSGRNISVNGRDLCNQVGGLLDDWPVPVQSITFLGFSMGGLIARSAMHVAAQEEHTWLTKVDKAVYVGTPHHGAVMERGGYWLQKGLTFSPYTAPVSALGRIRSAGITDLRHGNVQDDDWQHHDEHEDNSDYRRPTPLVEGVKHYTIAATLSKQSGERIGKLLGDGLVHPSSATGRHDDPLFDLSFPEGHTKILYDLGHLGMLNDPRVMAQLSEWVG